MSYAVYKCSPAHKPVVHCLCDYCGQRPCAVEKHSHTEHSQHTLKYTPSQVCSHIHKHEQKKFKPWN